MYHRDPESRKRFGARWRKIRELYLSKHPLCEHCLEIDLLVPATEVHHIVPVSEGGGDEDANLMSLCKACHSSKTLAATKRNQNSL